MMDSNLQIGLLLLVVALACYVIFGQQTDDNVVAPDIENGLL